MAKQNKTKWDALSMKDRASFIKIGIKNGFTDLEEIKDKYNIYANGGDKEEIKRDDDWKINLASKVLSSGLIPDRLKKRAIELGMRMSGGDPSPAKMSDIQSYLNTSSGRDLIIKALITKTPIKELLDNQFFNDEDLAAQLYNSGASQEKISEILGPYLAMENYGGLSPNNDFIDMDVGAFIGKHPNDYDFVETYLYNKIPFESSGVIKIDDKDSTRLGRYKDYINKNYKERYIPTYQGHVDTLDMNLVKDLNLKSLNKETSTYGVSTDETLPFEFGNKEDIRGYYDAGGYNLELIRGKDGKIYGRKSDIYDFLPKDFTNKWGEELNSTYKQFIPILDGVGNPFIFRSPWFDAEQIYIPEKIMQNFNKKHNGGPIKYDANNAGKYKWTIDDSISLIKQFEGYRNKAYQLKDGNGNEQWLGGYGHALTPEEIGLYSKENAVIPDEVINGWLEKDIQEKRKNIKTFYGENISEHLEALLLSLAYHGGDKLIRGPRESDNTKGKGWSPNFEKAVNAYILDSSIANIDAVIEQMQYRDDVLGQGKDGLTSRYGLYRAMFDGTADPSKIAEYYKNNTFRHYRSNKANIKDTGGGLDGLEGLPVFMYRPEYMQQAAQDYITDNQVFGDYNIPEVEVSRKGKKLPSVNSKEGKERIKFLAQRIANGDSTLDAVPTKYKKNVERYLSGIEFGKEVAKREGYEGLQAFATAAPLAAVPGIFSTMTAATPATSSIINPASLMNPITKGQLAKQLALDMGWGITGYEGTNKLSEWMTGKPFNQTAYDQLTSGLSPEDIERNREWGEAVLDMANPGGWLGLNPATNILRKTAKTTKNIASGTYKTITNPQYRRNHMFNSIDPYSYVGIIPRGSKALYRMIMDEPMHVDFPKFLKERIANRVDYKDRGRIDAWRIYNHLPQLYNTYTKTANGTYRYNLPSILQDSNYPGYVSGMRYDGITGAGAGLTGEIRTELGKTAEGNIISLETIRDTWDLNPFRKIFGNSRIPILRRIGDFEMGKLYGGTPFEMITDMITIQNSPTSRIIDPILNPKEYQAAVKASRMDIERVRRTNRKLLEDFDRRFEYTPLDAPIPDILKEGEVPIGRLKMPNRKKIKK